MEHTEIVRTCEECEFFRGFDRGLVDRIAGLCQVETYGSGECVFQQGDRGERVYVVAEGQVVLERAIDLGTRKGSVVIDLLGRGKFFGGWSTLLGEPHTLMSKAVCQRPTKVLTFRGSDLRDMMLNNKEIGFQLMERACLLLRERIRAAYGALEKI